MLKNLFVFLSAFLMAGLISPLIISLSKKFKAKQTILHYVKEHELKQGTPTMGGIIFIVSCFCISLACFSFSHNLALASIFTMFCYGFVGFLDDYLKIKYKQNLGLKAYQKLIGQVGIGVIISIFAYNNFGGSVFIPFTDIILNFGIWIIPINVVIFVAVVNSVNLLDGLDGLASGVSFVIILTLSCLIMIIKDNFVGHQLSELNNLVVCCYSMCGGLLAYFGFNCFPAKVFMGDTGSLALGGFICSVAIFSGLTLYIPIVGFWLVITSLSDIIQVFHYKRTRKRIFKMAPFHHHLEMSGVHENRIVAIYIISTIIICVLVCSLILL